MRDPFPKPKTVTLFSTCLADLFYPQVRHSTKSLLESLGYQVLVPSDQTCCGQPAFNSGKWETAAAVAECWLKAFSGADCVVVPSASCAAMVRVHIAELFAGDAPKLEQVRRLAEKTFELVEFLTYVHREPVLAGKLSGQAVTYHHSCHQRELGMAGETEALLNKSGATVAPLEGKDECCGFGGTFSARMPEVSGALLERKLGNIRQTDARVVTANDLGCLMNMGNAARKSGLKVEFKHVAELLAPKDGVV